MSFVIFTGEHSKTSSSVNQTGTSNTTPGLVRMTDDIQRQSPPKAIVDSTPLQPQMDKNKECKYKIFFYVKIIQINSNFVN